MSTGELSLTAVSHLKFLGKSATWPHRRPNGTRFGCRGPRGAVVPHDATTMATARSRARSARLFPARRPPALTNRVISTKVICLRGVEQRQLVGLITRRSEVR